MYLKYIKRILDFILSFIALILISPLFIVIVVFLSIANNGKPFFIQVRPGLNEQLFSLYKFKTMNDKVDDNGKLLSDKDRLTKIGKFVRTTSLDELPQLINVLKGEMSLIGPRPLLIKYLERYTKQQKTRHNVRPGITGWAQINGRNTISWERKLEFDCYYVNNLSFKLDFKIIVLTLIKVIKREGINGNNSATSEEFLGNNKSSK